MLLRNSLSNTKKFLKKTLGTFKSFFSGSYQRLPKTPPSFALGIDVKPDFNAEEPTFTKQEKEVQIQNGGLENNGNAVIERVGKVKPRMDICYTHQRKRQENESYNSECLRYDQKRMCLVAQKMKELEMSGLDIDELLHYYSRLNCPVYLEIVDRFFMEVFAEFSANSFSPKTCSVKSKLRPKSVGLVERKSLMGKSNSSSDFF